MLTSMRKFFKEKGQGLTEYVLILAFVAALAFMMFGSENSLKSDVTSTFKVAQSQIKVAGSGASN